MGKILSRTADITHMQSSNDLHDESVIYDGGGVRDAQHNRFHFHVRCSKLFTVASWRVRHNVGLMSDQISKSFTQNHQLWVFSKFIFLLNSWQITAAEVNYECSKQLV